MDSHLQDLLDLTALPPVSPFPEPEIMLNLRAESAAYAILEVLRAEALQRGENTYNAGPGKKRLRDWESLSEEDPVYRREKKTKSAYVSRFRAKEYQELLEGKIQEIESQNMAKKNSLQQEIAENNMLKAEILRLQMELEKKDRDCSLVTVQCKVPDSPYSLVTNCSTPDKMMKSIPEIKIDEIPLLPHTFSKMEAVLENWTSDESEDVSDFLFQ